MSIPPVKTEHIEEYCGTTECPRCVAVYTMLRRFQIQQIPPRYSGLFQLAEHAVNLEEAKLEYQMNNTLAVVNANVDLVSEAIKEASKHISMGCKVEDPHGSICNGNEENSIVIKVPLSPRGQPNANGDVFPDDIQIPAGTKVVGQVVRDDKNYSEDNDN